MPTLGANVLTLADHAKRLDPSGKVAAIVEMLSQNNEILQDIPFMEGNLVTGHQSTIRTGLPSVYWRLINQAVTPSKSTTAQVTDGCGLLEAWSEVDVELAKLANDVGAFRLSESSAFVEAMGQEMAQTLVYGNSGTAPEEFNGLAVRYSSLSATNASHILNAGGVGSDNSSIYLVCWGADRLFGTFPKGSQAGLEHKDLGEQTVTGGTGIAGSRLRAFQDQFIWKGGLVVKDWRYCVRIANIDISNLIAKSSAADLIELMIKAYHRIPAGGVSGGNCAFYMNRTVKQMLDIQMRDDVQVGGQLGYANVDGKPVMNFRGIPVKLLDQLLETEAAVS